jgi:hypothetical protein
VTVIAAAASTNNVTPGVLGFLIVAGMGVALFFLLRSMNHQFRKITPAAPPGKADKAGAQAADHASKAGAGKDDDGRDRS